MLLDVRNGNWHIKTCSSNPRVIFRDVLPNLASYRKLKVAAKMIPTLRTVLSVKDRHRVAVAECVCGADTGVL